MRKLIGAKEVTRVCVGEIKLHRVPRKVAFKERNAERERGFSKSEGAQALRRGGS